jgi:hypothetical protein
METPELRNQISAPTFQPTNGLAIASVILGLLSILYTLIAAIPAVLLGCLALGEINRSQSQKGRGLALAGVALGVLGILLTFVYAAILAPIVLPAVERNDLFARLQQLAEATEVSDSPIIARLCAVISFPAFLLGPFLVVWGLVDWRPVREHRWRWGLVAISFATLGVNPSLWADPWCRLFLTGWWFANIPGYVVFWIVASSDSRNRYVAPRRRAKKPSR